MKYVKKTILATALFLLISQAAFAQTTATYDEVISKQKKGQVDKYITQNGEEFKVGDTINLGVAFRNEEFDFIQQNAGLAFYPLPNTAANSIVVIKKINIMAKTVYINTTKPQGFVFGLTVINFESAIKNGEIISKMMSSDNALSELKRCKDKFDLGLITEIEYNKKKAELTKYIK